MSNPLSQAKVEAFSFSLWWETPKGEDILHAKINARARGKQTPKSLRCQVFGDGTLERGHAQIDFLWEREIKGVGPTLPACQPWRQSSWEKGLYLASPVAGKLA